MAISGKDTVWKHATNGAPSTNTDYTSKTRNVSLNCDGEEVDATVFGDGFRDYEQSFKNATITGTYKYDATIWQVVADLYSNGTSITWELGPVGSSASSPKITGSMICKSFTQPFNVGELQMVNVNFRVTGAVTFTTY